VGKGLGVRGFRLPLLFKEGRGVVAGFKPEKTTPNLSMKRG